MLLHHAQVIVDETTMKLSLMDDEGEATLFHLMMRLADVEQKNKELTVELLATQDSLDQERAETTQLKNELHSLSSSSEVSKLKDGTQFCCASQ